MTDQKWIKVIAFWVWWAVILYLFSILVLNFSINHWLTNADSTKESFGNTNVCNIIPASTRQIHKYIVEHNDDAVDVCNTYQYLNGTTSNPNWFPQGNWWLQFVVDWINTRKTFVDAINKYSKQLQLDPDLVISCVLWEQIRIANKWARWKLKDVVLHSTPTLFRSYNTSLWLWWIKVTTAQQVRGNAIDYWYDYFDQLLPDIITSNKLIKDDDFNAKYATYLVKNIIYRWQLSGYDISNNPGVVCTLYNLGNRIDKVPNANPQIWGSVIRVGNHDYTYGWLSMGVYRYLKIYK